MKTVILAGGGTAGHITPHVALYPYLADYFDKIYYIGSGKPIENQLIAPLNIKIYKIDPPALLRSLTLKNALIPFKMAKAVKQCKAILKDTDASVVFSKGGYCALPVCIAANKLKIPVVCHESDLSVGLANKLVFKKCAYFLTTFEQTALNHGGICVGPPINKPKKIDKQIAQNTLGINTQKPVLLITGGSQGSATINQAVILNIAKLTSLFFVIHLYGKGKKCAYNATNNYLPLEFADMNLCMSACDICLSRGGSNTLFELLFNNVPSLIAPLKKGSRGDQIKNAQYFKNLNAIKTCDEEELEKNITSLVCDLYKNRTLLKENIKKLNITNGTKKTFEYIKAAAENKNIN
ncbi:MAG: UDP-N-acetylglucosamine--N-acetylmuramyl-(pentapeptide) pyrophosphoryl-undecaprenol N-acetylglucosamine transferase [Clostridia bacterium]|nr:UDP-N-acetylglucosamine--N-acetylmuramyl-(pentapeptide) pyrophosphoryl-undecaprenol N-acetylglucosamine transferase [Clostridia bacterium]